MCNAPMKGVKRMWHGGSYSPQSAIESENSVRAFPKSCCTMQNMFGRARKAIATLQQLFSLAGTPLYMRKSVCCACGAIVPHSPS